MFGVPQGSILEPLLLIIFELIYFLSLATLTLEVSKNDNTAHVSGKNLVDVIEFLQQVSLCLF